MAPNKPNQPKLEFITITKPTTVGINVVEPGAILEVPKDCPEEDAKVLIGVGKAKAGKLVEEAAALNKRWTDSRARGAKQKAARAGGGENMVELISAVASLTASVAKLQEDIAELKAAQPQAKGGK